MEQPLLYTFTIEDRDETPKGVLLREGEDWVLVRLLSDFRFDGYELIKKEHIMDRERGEREIFIEEVLNVNNRWHELNNSQHIDIPLDTKHLFKYLREKSLVIYFAPKDDSIGYLGYIDRATSKSFFLRKLDTRAQWDDYVDVYRLTTPRKIQFETDYIESLIAYHSVFVAE